MVDLANATVRIISQYLSVSNQHIKLTPCYMSLRLKKPEGKKIQGEKQREPEGRLRHAGPYKDFKGFDLYLNSNEKPLKELSKGVSLANLHF